MNVLNKIKELRSEKITSNQYLDCMLDSSLIKIDCSKYVGLKFSDMIEKGIVDIEKTKKDLLRDSEIVIRMLNKIDETKIISSPEEISECVFIKDLEWKINFYIHHIIPSCVVLNSKESQITDFNYDTMILRIYS